MNKKEEYFKYVAQKCDKIKEELTDKLDTENTNKVFELLVLTIYRNIIINKRVMGRYTGKPEH